MNKNNKYKRKRIDLNDIINKKFGKLKILSYSHATGGTKHYFYKCQCDCGNIITKERSSILNKINLQCTECYFKEKADNMIKSMIGRKIGRLKVINFDHMEENKDKRGRTANKYYFKCQCDCGNTCVVEKHLLLGGGKLSCGCYHDESASLVNTSHGMSKTRFYRIWADMISRCTNSNVKRYDLYGGRGIKVCTRWMNSFENFMEDMYESYLAHSELYGESNTTIERINVDGNYEPSNCTWKTKAEQNRNMTNSFRLVYNGTEYIAAELYRMFSPDICKSYFTESIHKAGYESGDIINLDTCYNDIFKGTHIERPIEFYKEGESYIESPIEFTDNPIESPIEIISYKKFNKK